MYLLINAFIIFHLFLITVWLFPLENHLVNLVSVFRGYAVFIGLDQDYSMFAPSPPRVNKHVFALITFQDQSTALWLYPRMEELKFWQSISKERYRKFAHDNVLAPCFKMFWPDFARYIARLHACKDNEPVLVSIYVREEDIVDPLYAFGGETMVKPAPRLRKLFSYKVQAADLR